MPPGNAQADLTLQSPPGQSSADLLALAEEKDLEASQAVTKAEHAAAEVRLKTAKQAASSATVKLTKEKNELASKTQQLKMALAKARTASTIDTQTAGLKAKLNAMGTTAGPWRPSPARMPQPSGGPHITRMVQLALGNQEHGLKRGL